MGGNKNGQNNQTTSLHSALLPHQASLDLVYRPKQSMFNKKLFRGQHCPIMIPPYGTEIWTMLKAMLPLFQYFDPDPNRALTSSKSWTS